MSRAIIGLIIEAAWPVVVGCFVGEWSGRYWALIGLNAVVGAIVGWAVSAFNSPPLVTGVVLGIVGSVVAFFAFIPQRSWIGDHRLGDFYHCSSSHWIVYRDSLEALDAQAEPLRIKVMNPDEAKEQSDRDQLWASLRGLQPEIERLAAGEFNNTERERQLAMVIARIVVAEIKMRASDAMPD